MLRLDLVHPIVSGNKWYKLKGYIEAAIQENAHTLASFGGPFSNHIVALAFAGKTFGFSTTGYIRYNQNETLTPSLLEAMKYGMELIFLGRTHFQEQKARLLANKKSSGTYFIDEGGYGILGVLGFSSIAEEVDIIPYDYIIAAVGTGTMLAGLINISNDHQKVIGIPVLKNEGSIEKEINTILPSLKKTYTLLHQFHQGGYAKTSEVQINCMNQFWKQNGIATDIVYTGKLITAMDTLLKENYFEKNSKILLVHSGGLQGNRSLAPGILAF
jgi:1-aminocyclopropane-1-carboxylate deaminase